MDSLTDLMLAHYNPTYFVVMKLFWAGVTGTTLALLLKKIFSYD